MSANEAPTTGIVTTIAAKCRRCYNCVRSCPAKAIRVQSGQAYVMAERCIGCGNCIRVCAQHAKQVEPAGQLVNEMLAGNRPTVAILAPSYPAAFDHATAGQTVAAVRALGFDTVLEVGFGAEMVAREYARLLKQNRGEPLISTPCPALVSYIQKYMPDLVPHLAPVVSPMIALALAVKRKYSPGADIVFIGPCIAKKAELRDPAVAGAVDAALTFIELEELLGARGIVPATLAPSLADEPLPGFGGLFPVSGGLLKAAAIQADLMDSSILVVEGPDRCIAALNDLREGHFAARFLDALLCEGCIAGPAYSCALTPLARKERVTAHVRDLQSRARALPRAMKAVAAIPLARSFEAQPIVQAMPTETEIRDILARTNKIGPESALNCGACGYPSCRDKAIAVYQGLAEPEMCLPFLIDQLQINLERLSRSKEEIERARELAMRAEQLASMGRLSSDIAGEISNPLGNVIVFARLLWDSMPEGDLRRDDLATIIAESQHCREVLAGLRAFARQREPRLERVRLADIVQGALAELEPRTNPTEITINVDVPPDLPLLLGDAAQLSQVVLSILTNSVEAIEGPGWIAIAARATDDGRAVELRVQDTGRGIEPALVPRLFEPFVTTKGSRRGFGLGLAVAHGVVQAHAGDIRVHSRPGQGTTVIIRLPVDVSPAAPPEGVKVLVVDDDPDFLEQHRIMLAGMGFAVVTAERSDEALEVSNREIPDAFVLDLMMERTDSGARLARALRRDPRFRRAPIVLLTSVVNDMGFEFHRNPREVLEWMKADAWFDKPAPMAELANTLRRLLADPGRTQTSAESGVASAAPEPPPE